MELSDVHKKKVKWTTRMAFASLGILILTFIVNEFRHLFGFAKGYAPHNFTFNFGFFLPAMLLALIFGLAVIGRTIKNWKNWTEIKKKWTLIGLSFPAIGIWIFFVLRLVLRNPY